MSKTYDPKNTGSRFISPGIVRQATLQVSDLSRMLPRQLSTGSTRGQQRVGYGNAMLDGNNNRIIIGDPSGGGSVGMGTIPGTNNEFGFFSLDANGDLIMKIVNGTMYVYDLNTDKNVMQIGKLPSDNYGIAVAKTGFDVADGYI